MSGADQLTAGENRKKGEAAEQAAAQAIAPAQAQEPKRSGFFSTICSALGLRKAESAAPAQDKKAARFALNAFNFLGLHWVGNSALSLWITYNLASKEGTQKVLHTIARGITPVVHGWEKAKASIGLNGLSKLSKEMRAAHINQTARSFTETAVMCLAGSIILVPVKKLEDHKTQIIDSIDGVIHPNREKPDASLVETKGGAQPEEHKETWTNLIRARVLALFPIFWLDNRIQAFNNTRSAQNLPNIDTAEWNMGAKLYDKMKPTTRERFINFFSRKGISKDSIQPLVIESLEKTVGSDTGRMIFAEQTRMFSKEVSLSLIYTGFLFILGKTPIVPYVMEKCGIKSKKDQTEMKHALNEDIGINAFNGPESAPQEHCGHAPPPIPKPSFASRITLKEKPVKAADYTSQITAMSGQSAPQLV